MQTDLLRAAGRNAAHANAFHAQRSVCPAHNADIALAKRWLMSTCPRRVSSCCPSLLPFLPCLKRAAPVQSMDGDEFYDADDAFDEQDDVASPCDVPTPLTEPSEPPTEAAAACAAKEEQRIDSISVPDEPQLAQPYPLHRYADAGSQ